MKHMTYNLLLWLYDDYNLWMRRKEDQGIHGYRLLMIVLLAVKKWHHVCENQLVTEVVYSPSGSALYETLWITLF